MIFDKKVSREDITLDSLNNGKKYYFVHENDLDEERMDGTLSYSILEFRDFDSVYCEYLVECEFADGELRFYSKDESCEIGKSIDDIGDKKFFELYDNEFDIEGEEIFEECKYDSFENCSFGIENLNINEEKVSKTLCLSNFIDADGYFFRQTFQAYLNQRLNNVNRVVVSTKYIEAFVYDEDGLSHCYLSCKGNESRISLEDVYKHGPLTKDYWIYNRSEANPDVWNNKVIHVEYGDTYDTPSLYMVASASELKTSDIAGDIAKYSITTEALCKLFCSNAESQSAISE